jgi:hypothetical protein
MPAVGRWDLIRRSKGFAVVFTIHCVIALHVTGALCTHHQEYIKTVDAITDRSHVVNYKGTL